MSFSPLENSSAAETTLGIVFSQEKKSSPISQVSLITLVLPLLLAPHAAPIVTATVLFMTQRRTHVNYVLGGFKKDQSLLRPRSEKNYIYIVDYVAYCLVCLHLEAEE